MLWRGFGKGKRLWCFAVGKECYGVGMTWVLCVVVWVWRRCSVMWRGLDRVRVCYMVVFGVG